MAGVENFELAVHQATELYHTPEERVEYLKWKMNQLEKEEEK